MCTYILSKFTCKLKLNEKVNFLTLEDFIFNYKIEIIVSKIITVIYNGSELKRRYYLVDRF